MMEDKASGEKDGAAGARLPGSRDERIPALADSTTVTVATGRAVWHLALTEAAVPCLDQNLMETNPGGREARQPADPNSRQRL